jgi:hypothetical protein
VKKTTKLESGSEGEPPSDGKPGESTPEPEPEPDKKKRFQLTREDGSVASSETMPNPFYNLSLIKNVDTININVQGLNRSVFNVDDIMNTVMDINVTFSGEAEEKKPLDKPGVVFAHKRKWSQKKTLQFFSQTENVKRTNSVENLKLHNIVGKCVVKYVRLWFLSCNHFC